MKYIYDKVEGELGGRGELGEEEEEEEEEEEDNNYNKKEEEDEDAKDKYVV